MESGRGKKNGSLLHLHFNLLSISHCVWCCSKNCLVFAPHPYLWCFCERAPLNSNLPAITACGDEAIFSHRPSPSSRPFSFVTHSKFSFSIFAQFFSLPICTSVFNYFPQLRSLALRRLSLFHPPLPHVFLITGRQVGGCVGGGRG